ncbi:hypothetical protein SHY81_16500 [Bacillus velezensis]|nr:MULTISPECIES: hypothetical protein [Bacillus amyloliquefaciens group]
MYGLTSDGIYGQETRYKILDLLR